MTDTKNFLNKLEVTLNEYFGKQAPQLPENIKEIIVKLAPYLVIISVIFAIPALLVLLGLNGFATAIAPMGGVSSVASVPGMWLGTLLLIPSIVLEAMAIPGLFARKAVAWKYMFWSQLISVIASVLSLNLVGAIIGGLIGFYLLFQVKNYYK